LSSGKDDIDRKITSAMEKLINIQRMLLWDKAKKEGLSPIQIQILTYLNGYPKELCRVSDLAVEFDLTKATVSDTVSTLINKDLLVRGPGIDDRRSHTLALTHEGKVMVRRISKWTDTIQKKIALLNEDDKSRIMLFLMQLIKSLHDDGVINTARLCIACDNFEKNIHPGDDRPHRCGFTGKLMSDRELTIGCAYCKTGKN
jgi:DNA-binding MarR family transcriptional regulator